MSEGTTPAAGVRVLAPAKLNLALEVVGRRDDGYHDIATVMTTIDLADTVRLWPQPGAGLSVQLSGRFASAVHAGGEGERELRRGAARIHQL